MIMRFANKEEARAFLSQEVNKFVRMCGDSDMTGHIIFVLDKMCPDCVNIEKCLSSSSTWAESDYKAHKEFLDRCGAVYHLHKTFGMGWGDDNGLLGSMIFTENSKTEEVNPELSFG